MHNAWIWAVAGLGLTRIASAQEIPLNRYGLAVNGSAATYRTRAARDSTLRMVDLRTCVPHLKLQVYYATPHNFTHVKLYPRPAAFLRLPAATALREVALELAAKGLGLEVFDAYRPYQVTEKMWQVVPDDRYAADPRHGSGHNRGIAVDLTLYDLHTGKRLEMPTGFDDFTPRAHRDYTQLPQSVIDHRALLEKAMKKQGFVPLSTEWWHFSLGDASRYPLMDIPFDSLEARPPER